MTKSVVIYANAKYLTVYGLRAIILEMAPAMNVSIVSDIDTLRNNISKDGTVILSFAPIADIHTVLIDESANEKEIRTLIASQLGLNVNTPQSDTTGHSPLSKRETEVLRLVTNGLINKEVAEQLNISLQTVLSHRKNISAKLGIKTLSGLTVYAMMNGIK